MSEPSKKDVRVITLTKRHIKEIVDEENRAWIPPLRASEKTITDRLKHGHVMLGAKVNGNLVGKVCFSYSKFSPSDRRFAKTFKTFSSPGKTKERHNAAFVYNLDVRPEYRREGYGSILMKAAINRAASDHCSYMLIDGRPSSYNGSLSYEEERIQPSGQFKKAIDLYLKEKIFPEDQEFMYDPTLAFYRAVTKCKFYRILPKFLPEDTASGGIRVILLVNL